MPSRDDDSYWQPKLTSQGGDGERPWFMPDILVNVQKSGDDSVVVVIRDVRPDGSCRVSLGSTDNRETISALLNELEMVVPWKSDKIKIITTWC